MKTELNELSINGITYVPKGTENQMAETLDGLKYVICRTYSAGVFAGYLKIRNGQEVILIKARRLWYWSGAASLSQLAMEGTKNPKECKFPCEVEKVELLNAIEIIECTKKGMESIRGVNIWSA